MNYFTPSHGFFSAFPHGTFLYRLVITYLRLESGLSLFCLSFTGSDILLATLVLDIYTLFQIIISTFLKAAPCLFLLSLTTTYEIICYFIFHLLLRCFTLQGIFLIFVGDFTFMFF